MGCRCAKQKDVCYLLQVGLKDISATWEITELDMGPYKDKGHFKLRSVSISTVSLSVYYTQQHQFLPNNMLSWAELELTKQL